MDTEPTVDVIEPGEECTCDHCGDALDTGAEVYVDLPHERVYCCKACYEVNQTHDMETIQ